ncbi:MAG: hypothetical protein HY814_13335 [Candidatus Riflebacteria bacterium]|nr:hypothetical protein [Candidatus Riflebacteria bacterium]
MEPKYFTIRMFPTVALRGPELAALLDVFEQNPVLAPTHWGHDERAKTRYDRQELLALAPPEGARFSELWLHRKPAPAYSDSFSTRTGLFCFLDFEFADHLPRKYWEPFLVASERIADIARPSFGVTHMLAPAPWPWKTETERLHRWMHFCVQPTPVRVNPNGPIGLGHVTTFGPKLAALFGQSFLEQAPLSVEALAWGGFRLSLPSPAQGVPFPEQLQRWREAMDYLGQARVLATPVFEDDARTVSFRPGEAWLKRPKS